MNTDAGAYQDNPALEDITDTIQEALRDVTGIADEIRDIGGTTMTNEATRPDVNYPRNTFEVQDREGTWWTVEVRPCDPPEGWES